MEDELRKFCDNSSGEWIDRFNKCKFNNGSVKHKLTPWDRGETLEANFGDETTLRGDLVREGTGFIGLDLEEHGNVVIESQAGGIIGVGD